MAGHNSKHLICTISRNNRGLWTVYLPPIFLIKGMMASNSSGFCNSFLKCDRVVRPMSSPQPGGRTRGSQFVWSLHFTLFSTSLLASSPFMASKANCKSENVPLTLTSPFACCSCITSRDSPKWRTCLQANWQQRFLAQHSIATLLWHWFEWLQHCSTIATLCCAKNRCCELTM